MATDEQSNAWLTAYASESKSRWGPLGLVVEHRYGESMNRALEAGFTVE